MEKSIESIVKKLIKKYKTRNSFELADDLNIKVFIEHLGKNTKGFYQSCPRNRVIHINQDLDERESSFVCAHELGHALIHTKLNILFLEKNTLCVKNKYELEANIFASQLMIPDNLLNDYPSYFNLEQIAASEGLPIELLELKFKI